MKKVYFCQAHKLAVEINVNPGSVIDNGIGAGVYRNGALAAKKYHVFATAIQAFYKSAFFVEDPIYYKWMYTDTYTLPLVTGKLLHLAHNGASI